MKKILLAALAGLVLVSACKKDNDSVPTQQVSGTFSGSNEVPAITASGSGTFTGTYTPSTKSLSYTATFSGLTGAATASHLHFGDAKHSGPVTVSFTGVPAANSGTITGTATLTAQQADSLTAGRIYANIHTAANTGGELRANVRVK
ncbi:CHRD domain-containing protein [Hymenobacter setariae]|uniref:CHRD domain-containing protein n=1 Tax=Hymenobacter setariae TaxID=2594794 RepID=A0A558C4I1_9BACT|nr:CHRD domain-containing protein [Hymenobacter setariae]TVT43701.1 CHRD domain-containing protein [Hymenobacter setariae]